MSKVDCLFEVLEVNEMLGLFPVRFDHFQLGQKRDPVPVLLTVPGIIITLASWMSKFPNWVMYGKGIVLHWIPLDRIWARSRSYISVTGCDNYAPSLSLSTTTYLSHITSGFSQPARASPEERMCG